MDTLLPGTLQATFWPGGRVPADGHLALWGASDLAGAATELGLPAGRPATLPTVLPRSPQSRTRVAAADVPARVVPALPAVRALAALPSPAELPPWGRPSDAVAAWSAAAKLALELVTAGRIAPVLRDGGPGVVIAAWRAVPPPDGRLAALADALPPAAHALRSDEDDDLVWPPAALLQAFCDAVADACARSGPSAETGTARALSGPDPTVPVADADVEAHAAWAAGLGGADGRATARLCVRLETPDGSDPDAPWPLGYLLQAADDPSLRLPASEVWAHGARSMEMLGRRVGDPQESLVKGLAEAARLFPPIDRSLSEPRPTELDLRPDDVAELLSSGAAGLSAAGIGVLLPAELTAQGARRLRARLRVGSPTPDPGQGITSAGLDAEGLADFRWEVAIGDELLSAAELAEIAALKQPLVRWRGRWVRVDPDEALRLADQLGSGGRLDGIDALAAALAGEREVAGLGAVEVVASGGLAELVDRLRGAAPGEPRLAGVEATLRDYQLRGVAWLQAMGELGLGALLADDMGLGKTLQTIALLTDRANGQPHLVVCPTSVLGNWERELARFAPGLGVIAHHGPERADTPDGLSAGAVVVTSYGLVRRDADLLADVDWDVVVLDEAQQVKNHASQAARAVRRLPARHRVALTGTPVENRLSELWSIMDFCNPRLLGSFARFKERYAIPIERWRDAEAAARLRALSAPFVLRRAKTDPGVADDLPAKNEITVTCTLTREQVTLYQAAVTALLDDSELGEGIERQGRVLKLLTALKQICNHPAQYLGEPGVLRGRSGKLDRATEMLAEIASAGERALVFTQYRAMGDLLVRHLPGPLGLRETPFLHGGVARKRRDAMVERFQTDPAAPPVLLVSLKAGGTGLNLTRATHVLHFDRWWNPAVEDQATDRAYRIGQTRTVTVHKLVTAGTVEERIAALLEDKRALADAVVGSGEAWISDLSDDDLRDLVSLSDADVAGADAADLADVEIPA
ncbi:DEAD/DEAH box helicase [soil metagenome]